MNSNGLALVLILVGRNLLAADTADSPVAEDDPGRIARLQSEAENSSGAELCDWYVHKYAGDDLAERELRKRRLLTDREWKVVKSRQLVMGERQLVALCIWGEPTDKNTTVTAAGVREQWVYSPSRYIYFENGKLTAYSF